MRSQRMAKIGEKMITNSGSTDWNQLDGYVKPKTVSRVARSANSVRLEPACSKPAQNNRANVVRIAIAPMRVQSAPVSARGGARSVCGAVSVDAATAFGLDSIGSSETGVRCLRPRTY